MTIIESNLKPRWKQVMHIDDTIKRTGYLVLTPKIISEDNVDYIDDNGSFREELLEFLSENPIDHFCVNLGQVDIIYSGQIAGLLRFNEQHEASRGEPASLISNRWIDKLLENIGLGSILDTYRSAQEFCTPKYV